MITKTIGLFLVATFGFCPFFSPVNAADKYSINYDIPTEHKEIKNIVEKTINEVLKIDGEKISFLSINVGIGNQYQSISYTDAKSDNCKININYKDYSPLLLSNFNSDIEFIVLHEIGHCILGKKIFYKEDIQWQENIKNSQKLNEKIKFQTNVALSNLQCRDCTNKKFIVAPPIAVYHETYADIYALMWWVYLKNDLTEIVHLSKKRIDNFNENPLSSFYATGFSIPIFLEYIESPNAHKSFESVEIISQKGFEKYLNFISENLNKFKKEINND